MNELEKCNLCPRKCGINRTKGEVGICRNGVLPKVAKIQLHNYEEPCISGSTGSGTIFFSGCNLMCKFCQNYKISQENKGKEMQIEELALKMIELQNQGANNINLVTAFSFIPQIVDAVKIAKSQGLNIPIVYNTSGYESVESLKMLNGIVDIYLPDLKYFYNDLGEKLSNVKDYFEIATIAIKEMLEQIKKTEYDENGMMKKGIIIRHLVLPNHIQNTKQILKWIKNNIKDNIPISVMAQYFPTYMALETEDVNRKLTLEEFEEIENFIYKLNLKNGYIQYLEDDEEKYVPEF